MLHRGNDRGNWARPDNGRGFVLSIAVIAVLLGALNFSCLGLLRGRTTTIDLEPILDSLSAEYPEYFADSPALILFVDTSPCGKAFLETVWWREWQQAATEADINFLLVTSESDSSDVAVAARLDSVTAPVLVAPSCKHRLSELGIPEGTLPTKILLDEGGELRGVWLPIRSETRSAMLMDKLSEIGHKSK